MTSLTSIIGKMRDRRPRRPLRYAILLYASLSLLALILLGLTSPTVFSDGDICVDTSGASHIPMDSVEHPVKDGYYQMEELHEYSWKYSSDCALTWLPSLFGYKDTSVHLSVELDRDWYLYYHSISRGRSSESHIIMDDPYCLAIAKALLEATSGASDRERIDMVLRFVQDLEYEADDDYCGYEYWKFPAETLWEGKGDCEDKAILFTTLTRMMGYDSTLVWVTMDMPWGIEYHVASGIALDDLKGAVFTLDGKDYVYCEATARLGFLPVGAIYPLYYPCEWCRYSPLPMHFRF